LPQIKKILLTTLLLLLTALGASAQVTTTVADKLVTGTGIPVTGTLKITAAVAMTAADGTQVPAGQITNVVLSSTGTFSVSLIPTIGAAPYNAFYYVDYTTTSSRVREEWTIPVSSTSVNLKQVRVIWPLAPNVLIPASQFVPPPTCTPIGAATTNLVLRYTTNPVGWICAPDNTGDVTLNLENPTPLDAGKFQWSPKNGLTITGVSCSVDTGTVSVNLDVRSAVTPNNPGQEVLSVDLLCNSTTTSTTSFSTTAVPGGAPVALLITNTTGAPGIVRVYVNYLLN